MKTWQLQEAKSKFSRLVNDAVDLGPQFVTRHNIETVVVLSAKDYHDIIRKKEKLIDLLKKAPKAELDLNRPIESIRELEL